MHVAHAWDIVLHQIWWDGDAGVWLYIVMAPYHMSPQHEDLPHHEWLIRFLANYIIIRRCWYCGLLYYDGEQEGCTNPECDAALVVACSKHQTNTNCLHQGLQL